MKTNRIDFYLVIWSVVGEMMILIDLIVSVIKKRKKALNRDTKKRWNTRTS